MCKYCLFKYSFCICFILIESSFVCLLTFIMPSFMQKVKSSKYIIALTCCSTLSFSFFFMRWIVFLCFFILHNPWIYWTLIASFNHIVRYLVFLGSLSIIILRFLVHLTIRINIRLMHFYSRYTRLYYFKNQTRNPS